MKAIKIVLEIIGWCQIAFGATLFFALIAAALYYSITNRVTEIISIIIIVTGFIIGSIWATVIWSKYGTVAWLSGIRRIK
jgi:hypothetical protein